MGTDSTREVIPCPGCPDCTHRCDRCGEVGAHAPTCPRLAPVPLSTEQGEERAKIREEAEFLRESKIGRATCTPTPPDLSTEQGEERANAEKRARWEAAGFACENCHRAPTYDQLLPGVKCVMCPFCNDGHLLVSAWYRVADERDEARSELAQREAEIEKLCEQLESVRDLREQDAAEITEAREALERIASGRRPDGSYNLSREACEEIARSTLNASE